MRNSQEKEGRPSTFLAEGTPTPLILFREIFADKIHLLHLKGFAVEIA